MTVVDVRPVHRVSQLVLAAMAAVLVGVPEGMPAMAGMSVVLVVVMVERGLQGECWLSLCPFPAPFRFQAPLAAPGVAPS